MKTIGYNGVHYIFRHTHIMWYFFTLCQEKLALKVDEPIMVIFHGSVELQESKSTKHTKHFGNGRNTENCCIYNHTEGDKGFERKNNAGQTQLVVTIYTYTHTLCIYIYIHYKYISYVHTYVRTYIHTCMQTYIHPSMHAHKHTYIHTSMHTYLLTYFLYFTLLYFTLLYFTLLTYLLTYLHPYIHPSIHPYMHIHTASLVDILVFTTCLVPVGGDKLMYSNIHVALLCASVSCFKLKCKCHTHTHK